MDQRKAEDRIEQPGRLEQPVHRDDEQELGQHIGHRQPTGDRAARGHPALVQREGCRNADGEGHKVAQKRREQAVKEPFEEGCFAPDLGIVVPDRSENELRRHGKGIGLGLERDAHDPQDREQAEEPGDDPDGLAGR